MITIWLSITHERWLFGLSKERPYTWSSPKSSKWNAALFIWNAALFREMRRFSWKVALFIWNAALFVKCSAFREKRCFLWNAVLFMKSGAFHMKYGTFREKRCFSYEKHLKSLKTADSTQISHLDLVFHRVQREGHSWKAPLFERPLARNCNPMFPHLTTHTFFYWFLNRKTYLSQLKTVSDMITH